MKHGHTEWEALPSEKRRSGRVWAFWTLTWLLWLAFQVMVLADARAAEPQQLMAKAEAAASRPSAEATPADPAKKVGEKTDTEQAKPGAPAITKPKPPAADTGGSDWPTWTKPSVHSTRGPRGVQPRHPGPD